MKNSLVWFRNDLRTIDNQSLSKACETSEKVIAVYCFDPLQFAETDFGFPKTGKFRAKFLLETVKNLQQQLKKLNIPLLIYHDSPENILPSLVEKHKINTLYLQREWTEEEVAVEENVRASLPNDISIQKYYDQFLFHPEDIPFDDFTKIPKVFTEFRKRSEKNSEVRKPISKPEPLSEKNLIENEMKLPTLHELGLEDFEVHNNSAFPFSGGEEAAWERLDHYFWKTKKLQEYKQTRNGLLGEDYSSKFSAWLANGSISARSIYAEVKKFESEITKNQDTYWLVFELIWRDFFKYVSLQHGSKIFQLGGILEKEYDWKKEEDVIKNWIEGNTEYDFVNANMNEIAATGFMSNRGRQNVASYFAKEKYQDWRIGASYFESMLIDYDVHSNWGNWMYNAGVGNDPRDRKFNIEKQADRYDPDKKYVKGWIKK
ncbi:DASH family cryptochrome [Luteirhabdus pelagi]|uniref:DASH family cryptochrome n=1 Tax=Luteirhabdus pelagi TaxID=2792783 RepID=UPI00193A46C3|nr:DASH family cryptochrome [Luteirhabdus pelagi]